MPLSKGVVAGSTPARTANVEVVLHGEKKVSAENQKNNGCMRVKIPSTFISFRRLFGGEPDCHSGKTEGSNPSGTAMSAEYKQ
jgi:hypothetical protein